MEFVSMRIVEACRAALLNSLAWIGQQGTRALVALVVVGIAFPTLGELLKPYLTEAVFVLLCIAFLGVDAASLKTCFQRPLLVVAATLWTAVALPLIFGGACLLLGLDRSLPDLFLALMLQAVASPMMAAPALAALMGLDATLVLVTLVTSTALIPITAPVFAFVFVGPGLSFSPLALAAKLSAILLGAALLGFVLRKALGKAFIARQKMRIHGFNILVLFVFVAALMEKVGSRFLAAPSGTLALAALAFALFFAILCLTTALFLPAGRESALALGFMASQRNMGLMLAATGGGLPEMTWLYFALSQFPIYLSPQLLKPLAHWILARPAGRSGPKVAANE
jgi:predicted Na+-dependent transporter